MTDVRPVEEVLRDLNEEVIWHNTDPDDRDQGEDYIAEEDGLPILTADRASVRAAAIEETWEKIREQRRAKRACGPKQEGCDCPICRWAADVRRIKGLLSESDAAIVEDMGLGIADAETEAEMLRYKEREAESSVRAAAIREVAEALMDSKDLTTYGIGDAEDAAEWIKSHFLSSAGTSEAKG
jgi:hypothetical protein